MSDPARFLQDQDDLMCSNSGYPQLTTEQMSQLLSSIQQSQPGLLQQVPQINSMTALPPPGMASAGMLASLSSMPVQHTVIDRSICAQSRQTGPTSKKAYELEPSLLPDFSQFSQLKSKVTSITALYQKAIESIGKSGGAGAEFRETPAFKILEEPHLSQDPLVRPQALLDRTRPAGAMHQDVHVTEETFAENGTPGYAADPDDPFTGPEFMTSAEIMRPFMQPGPSGAPTTQSLGTAASAGRTTARDALTSQRTATVPAASSQSLQSAAQTDSTATSPDKGPAPAQKDPYNKGHKVHRKHSGDTRADKVLHTVESMQQREAKRQATQSEASQQGVQYMAQQMAFGMVQMGHSFAQSLERAATFKMMRMMGNRSTEDILKVVHALPALQAPQLTPPMPPGHPALTPLTAPTHAAASMQNTPLTMPSPSISQQQAQLHARSQCYLQPQLTLPQPQLPQQLFLLLIIATVVKLLALYTNVTSVGDTCIHFVSEKLGEEGFGQQVRRRQCGGQKGAPEGTRV
ncbi:TPA: hypothetical protein ACH3X1_009192 [Trebouxia sp. C0004]